MGIPNPPGRGPGSHAAITPLTAVSPLTAIRAMTAVRVLAVTGLTTVLATALIAAPASAAPAPAYDLAGGCYALKVTNAGASRGGYVARNAVGYSVLASEAKATPFRLQATGLGRYAFYGPDGQYVRLSAVNNALPAGSYDTRTDWTVVRDGTAYKVSNTATGQSLGGWLGLLAVVDASVTVKATTGCAQYPEIGTDTSGTAAPGVDAAGNLVGPIDAHAHLTASEAFGGRMHCGDAFAAGGAPSALAPCPSHAVGAGALFEAVIGGTDLLDVGDAGWPGFTDWPENGTQLHEQAYYKGVERAWRGGLRVLNNLLVGNRVICGLYPQRDHSCDEMTEVRLQAKYLHAMEDYIDAQNGGPGKGWFRIATTPEQVRVIAAQGKLAVTIGVEVSELFGCREIKGVAQCDESDVDAGLDELQALGVSNLHPVHKFDNAFGGTRFDGGLTGAAVNIGNLISTGHWWTAERCTGPADNTQPLVSDDIADLLSGGGLGLPAGTIAPVYPSGPICNTRGLTSLGTYLINGMIKRGLLINIDHMGVKTAEAVADLAAKAHYPGLVSAHSWADRALVDRVLELGGFVASYPFAVSDDGTEAPTFLGEWRANRALPHSTGAVGYGFSSDVNGLAVQPPPRLSAATNPLKYPFTAPNGVVFDRHQYGQRTYDLNTDGVAEYGLYPDWIADLVQQAGADGPALQKDLMSGAEAYLSVWEAARA